jgi:superfamily II DNA or RNA helicase
MSNRIIITRSSGILKIEHIYPALLEELSFFYRFKDKIKKRIFDRRTGMMRDIFMDGPLRVVKKHLYSITPDDSAIITYDGLLHKIKNYFYANNVEFEIVEPYDVYVEPNLTERVFEGLYPDQRCAVELMISHDGGCMVEAATNTGKTRIIASLCRAYSEHKGLIVTNRQSVANKLYKDLLELAPECDPGVYLSNNKKKGRTLVITSASLKKFDVNQVDYIIYDEAHGAGSHVRSQDLLRFKKAVRYGLSATIKTGFKGIENYLEAIFGPIVFELTDQQLEAMNRATPLNVYVLDVVNGPNFTGKSQDLTMERNGVWYNRHRNKLIKECVEMAPQDQQLIIYVRTLAHLEELVQNFLPEGFEIFHGKLSKPEKDRILRGFNEGTSKRIISTDCLAEGVDPRNLFIMINANWMQSDVSVLQKAGRNRRLSEGKNFGVVIDFNDGWNDKMSRKAQNRVKHYKNKGYSLIKDCTPSDIVFVQN